MGKVQQLVDESRVTVDLGGVEFVLRRFNSYVAIEAIGAKAFGLVRGARSAKKDTELSEREVQQRVDMIKSYLAAGLVSPAIGEKTDDDADTITWEDLMDTGLVGELFMGWLEASGLQSKVQDFLESSQGEDA